MRSFRKIISLFVLLVFAVHMGASIPSYAAEYAYQPAPQKLRLDENSQVPIGYNEFDRHYADLEWDDPLGNPDPLPGAISKFVNVYLQEVTKPYRPSKPTALKEKDLPGNQTSVRLKDLSSGTVYYTYSRAYYTYEHDNTTYTSPESLQSNMIKFMTDVSIAAYSFGNRQIKIEWDDVWNSGRRIDYKLYISENMDFSGTPPIYIRQEHIGPNGPVRVNETTGKLEYVHTVRDPGRVYYIKVAPDIVEPELKRNAESSTVAASSFILAKTTKMSTTDVGTIWRIDWSPVVTGINSNNVSVSYQIYKGSLTSSGLPQYMASVGDTSFFVTIGPEEKDIFFLIKAIVTKDGEELYPGIKIESDKIIPKESEAPAPPASPEIVGEFKNNAGDVVISYSGQLKPNSATILWRAPKKATGAIDSDIVYDIWLISDPNQIDNPPDSTRIASDLIISDSNKVMSGNEFLGYKYDLTGLPANSTRYFKIVAKKTFIVSEDGTLVDKVFQSEPSLKVIITPASGPIDQPVVPPRPPLEVKTHINEPDKYMVTDSTAVIQIKNKWYEHFDGTKWVHWMPDQSDAEQQSILEQLEQGTLNDTDYRIVRYDPGVTINVGAVEYTEGMSYNDLASIPANKIINFPVTANDPDEDVNDNYDGEKHNVVIPITELLPNTTYIIWVRAARLSADLISGPSDPLIVTTNPVIANPVEKPTVPEFNYYNAADNYIDLGWNFRAGYNYYIKYGTVDDIDAAGESEEVTPADLIYTSYYRIKDLEADTLYYFFIQAESVNEDGITSRSEWSDSFLVKTLPPIPPATPRGFGIKNAKDSVTANSITYEWIKEDGLTYILEIASDIDYEDKQEYIAGDDVSELTVGKLRSNYRYYARLYAYDSEKNLMSEPTQSVTVRTKRSSDDYDSDQDIEDVITGDYVEKEYLAPIKTWSIKIIGVNAHRFIERVRNDSVLDYNLNLSKMPAGATRISLLVSGVVFEALSVLNENLVIITPRNQLTIRPDMLFDSSGHSKLKNTDQYNFEIVIEFPGSQIDADMTNIVLKSKPSQVNVNYYVGNYANPLNGLNRPLKVSYPYEGRLFKEGLTSGYVYDSSRMSWQKLDTVFRTIPGSNSIVAFETRKPGLLVIAEQGTDFYDDIARHWARNSIVNVASVYKIKNITGRRFDPEKLVTRSEAVKFMLDVLGMQYGSDHMMLGAKAGIIGHDAFNDPGKLCTREELIVMGMRVYELKSGEAAEPSDAATYVFDDMDQVAGLALPKVKFAIENGIVISRFSDILGPGDFVTRADTMVLLEKILAFAGEID